MYETWKLSGLHVVIGKEGHTSSEDLRLSIYREGK